MLSRRRASLSLELLRVLSMLMVALKWEARINPLLFPTGVVTHIGVTQRRQFTGGFLGSVSSRIGAVNDDLRTLIR